MINRVNTMTTWVSLVVKNKVNNTFGLDIFQLDLNPILYHTTFSLFSTIVGSDVLHMNGSGMVLQTT